jgi:hypothetical protein
MRRQMITGVAIDLDPVNDSIGRQDVMISGVFNIYKDKNKVKVA